MIVADASPLIFLGQLGRLDVLLAIFGSVIVPSAVFAEATASPGRPGAQAVLRAHSAGLFAVELVGPGRASELSELVDPGEAEAIALALERGIPRVLMDDLAGRGLARRLGLTPIGTLGVLVQARRMGIVEELPPLLDALESIGFRMTAALRQETERLGLS